MNTICFYAVPKFSDSGLKPEVFYKLDGFASADNPLSRFGRSRKLDKRDLVYVIRNAREISLSFNDALVRHYFDRSIGMLSDNVTLTDAELIRDYDSLKSEHQSDSEEFFRGCYEISLKQKQLDLEFMAMESELLLKTSFDAYSNHGKYNLNKALKEYFKARNFQKELEINLLLDRLGRLSYDSFKLVTKHWSANYCNLFGVMRKAKLIKPVINIGARKLEENSYRMGQRIALRSQDMTAARLTFLMLRAQKLLLPDYDFYYRCERKVG